MTLLITNVVRHMSYFQLEAAGLPLPLPLPLGPLGGPPRGFAPPRGPFGGSLGGLRAGLGVLEGIEEVAPPSGLDRIVIGALN